MMLRLHGKRALRWSQSHARSIKFAGLHRSGIASSSTPTLMSDMADRKTQKQILLLDVMDTIVVDPFFKTMPKFFGLTFDELMRAKHPSAWVEFERGEIDQSELFRKFFKDGRSFDGEALMHTMVEAYEYIQGMESLLQRLKDSGHEMHALSNYPDWYRCIENKLTLSRYISWTFISCTGPMKGLRKPDVEAYGVAVRELSTPAGQLIFVDDRAVNVDAAQAAGLDGILFKGAVGLEESLKQRGLQF